MHFLLANGPIISTAMYLQFKNVQKTYDQKSLVVADFNLSLNKGEFITLLGPSGSGKTTVLMMLAGFEPLSNGQILLEGQSIEKIPPYRRNIGVVFQNYALFPHMTVEENLAYPLKVRRQPKQQVQQRVRDFLDLIEMRAFGQRKPAELSGGQKQRVALARALIFEPSLVLMDEPLGALDKKLREQMQFEIMRLHEQLGFSVIYVTHDQGEALTMSDRIAVFNQGVVQQYAAPSTLYNEPSNAFVAGFIGENNILPIEIKQGSTESYIHGVLAEEAPIIARSNHTDERAGDLYSGLLAVRPEKIQINPHNRLDNQLSATFLTEQYGGDFMRYFFSLSNGAKISVKKVSPLPQPLTQSGQTVSLGWDREDCFIFQHK